MDSYTDTRFRSFGFDTDMEMDAETVRHNLVPKLPSSK